MVSSNIVLSSSAFFAGTTSSNDDWETMKNNWLKEDGMRIVDPKLGRFAIIRYDRSKSKTQNPSIPNNWLRSVVIDKKTCTPVCVAPCKATELPRTDDWASSMKSVEVQHFVDGVMINLFWMPDEDKPYVSTRSRIGADNNFYSSMSFVEMLTDAVKFYSSKKTAGFNGVLNDLKPVSTHPTPQFISIVLQHPKNRVVTTVKDPRITVVHVGFVEADKSVRVHVNPKDWNETLQKLAPGTVTLPDGTLDNFKALSDYVEAQGKEFGYMWQGLVLKGPDGIRYRIRNKEYSKVRSLRGNEADSIERFCRLRGERNIKKYLSYYPEDEAIFYELEGKLRSATRKILDYYSQTFKFKKTMFHTLPWPYKHHVSVLHNTFKEKLKPSGKTVELEVVVNYVNTLSVEDMANLFKTPKEPKADKAPVVVVKKPVEKKDTPTTKEEKDEPANEDKTESA